ncbi:Threonine--tRNA ligase catalytic [Seminavis robusta]|uniref:threonine--tRNA ligase n=1 Tax=Seminavis robusta TaxID=568900 RepID=A0A9N8HBK2_9STRA|nr:Threonine--tRNA ligase catalytic [Seminavis robusta]|eukprot:Sro185_g080510.1 Threonine--tRNA ligase catalytic (683) ;mRNA; r:92356-94681
MNLKISSMTLGAMLLSLVVRRAASFVPAAVRSNGARATAGLNSRSIPSSRHFRYLSATVAPEEAKAAAQVVEPEELPNNDNDEDLLKIRHSSAHVMAMAVQQIFKEAQVTIGPWIDNGFYYDFYFPETTDAETGETIPARKLSDQDLKKIKKAMDKIVSKNYPITREEVSREEAKRRIEEIGEPFKLEILEGIKTEPITIYHIGDQWWDLCAGPHVESTGKLPKKAIALQSVAGAYWRGDENREMLQRVYATAWKDPGQLKQYKKMLEEAKKRDHRMLGKKLDLFSIQEDAGGGLVFWHPKGSKIRRIIEDFWKDAHVDDGYDVVYSPHIANIDLWKTSGHFDFYRSDMFDQMDVENEQYQIKPMNCPFHCLMYKDELRSYRDLPFRWAELGTVYRYERSGTLHGLMRVRGFTQDDAHIFCLPEQLQDEIVAVLDLTETILSRFGFAKYDIMLSTRPEKAVGSDEIWDAATAALEGALKAKGWDYSIDEGGGAFYGPKIDLKIRDAIGRQWQCSTVQCDFNLPERFELEYVSAEGTRERPIMVHRAIFGSVERFFGILIENCSGDFPLWLNPTQMKILPVTDGVRDYCEEVAAKAAKMGLRVEIDRGNERLAKQIRNAEQQRVPIIVVVGEKEMESGTLAVRSRQLGDMGSFNVDDLLNEMSRCAQETVEMTTKGETEKKEE